MGKNVKISVVIPTYRRNEKLSRCLDCLLRQNFPPDQFEIIVVDDGCSLWTQLLCEDKQTGNPAFTIKYVPVIHSKGPAAARNLGWEAALGEIVAFTDDDCLPALNWLSQGMAHFSPNIIAAWGKISIPLGPEPTDYERNAAGLAHAEFATANCFCRRQALIRTGGFDERFKKPWREDADLFFTLLEFYPQQLIFIPEAVVIHPVHRAPFGISIRQQANNLFEALLFKKHQNLYRQKVQNHMRLTYYMNVAALAVMFLACARNWPWIALAGFLGWMLTTAAFCWRRLKGTSHDPKHVWEMVVTSIAIPPVAVFWRLAGALKFNVFFY